MSQNNASEKKKVSRRLQYLHSVNPLYSAYSEAIEAINQEFFVTNISYQSLQEFRETCKKKDAAVKISISIPSTKGPTIRQERRKSAIVEMLKKTLRTDLFASSLSTCISSFEAYLQEVLYVVLHNKPEKLLLGKNEKPSVPLELLIKANNKDDILVKVIQDKIVSLFYASPKEYFNKLRAYLEINIDESLFFSFIEMKATRDLIIHNKSRVNQVYVDKCGDYARTTNTKQMIPCNKTYYESCVSVMKRLIKTIYEDTAKKQFNITETTMLYLIP